MGMSWTPEQQKVIDLRKRNILVSAAAGSGKTAVLVERIKERILDKEAPIDIDELLVVTFTKAAAAQMRDRVGLAIEEELEKHPFHARLEQQLTLVHNAQITTIDSFCLYVIRNHFHEISLEPNFRIAEEGELKLLKQEVMERLLEEEYASGNEAFVKLADSYASGRSDEGLKKLILQLYEYAQSYPWPDEWLQECVEAYRTVSKEEWDKSGICICLTDYVAHVTEGVLEKIERALAICEQDDGPYMYGAAVGQDQEAVKELAACAGYEEIYTWMQQNTWAKLAAARGFTGDKDKQETVKQIRADYKGVIDGVKKKFFFASADVQLAQKERLTQTVQTLVQLTKHFGERLAERKRIKNIVDFNDLEHFALQILVDEQTKQPTAAAQEFRQAYKEIMIDEYQDSNYVQEAILCAISRQPEENNMFMVGDVKQSIYRFRLARPELFMEKFDTYTTEDSENQRIDLHKNFRSRQEVLALTNDIFRRIMRRSLGNVEYDDAAALYPGADYPEMEGMFEPEILLADTKSELAEEISQGDKAVLEGELIAAKIAALMEQQLITEEKDHTLRRLRYGDIVILLRSPSGYGDTIANVLMEHGIPAHTTAKTGYFSAPEVQTVLNYLRILDNPLQDIPLAAVLKSPIGGFCDEELAEVRIGNPEQSFAEAFLQGAKEHTFSGSLGEKTETFYTVYQRLRRETTDRPIHELLLMMLEETDYERIAAAMPGGVQRQANLAMLVEQAVAYEGTSYHGLFHFIRYIDQLQKYNVDYGEADLVSENADAVRIMSIHKSKGLEFPVVFVSGLGKQFNKQDSRSRMLLHHSLGIGLDEIDVARRLKVPTLTKRVIANQSELEGLGEELRVLYVALTRAKEKLILTGVKENVSDMLTQCELEYAGAGTIGYTDLAGAASYLDWVLPALAACKGCYDVREVSAEELVTAEAVQQIGQQERRQEYDNETVSETAERFVEQRLSYEYPYQSSIDLQMKYSVSEIKHREMRRLAQQEEIGTVPAFLEKPVVPYIPAFVSGEETKQEVSQGALRGTAVHRVLECLDFTVIPETDIAAEVECQLEHMLEEHLITKEQAELISVERIAGFLASDIGRRMSLAAKRGQLYREKPFVLGKQEEELILVQGIIDVFWQEEDHIILLDYKTDRVKSGEELCLLYRAQMELYQEALEAVWEQKVTEKYLYSFALSEAVLV